MIRILAVSLSTAALIAATIPAAAQQRQHGPSFRAPAQPSFTGKRFSGPKQPRGQRKFRSFNPPAPQISSGQRFHRSFNPPAPGGQAPTTFSRGLAPPIPSVATEPRYFSPQAPTGGHNVAVDPGSVPASLAPPPLGESSTTAAPAGQPTEAASQGDLQAPIPETVAAQSEPAATEEKWVGKMVRPQVISQVCEERVVYVPVYKVRRFYHRNEVYVPHRVYRGHRVHHGHHYHRGFRR